VARKCHDHKVEPISPDDFVGVLPLFFARISRHREDGVASNVLAFAITSVRRANPQFEKSLYLRDCLSTKPFGMRARATVSAQALVE